MTTATLPELPLSPKQIRSIVECENQRINIWTGAVRSGKTIASILAFFLSVNRAPKSGLILIVGRTLQTIERNILEPMQDETVYGKLSFLVKHTRGSSIATICGRTVHLIGANDAAAESKIRGSTCSLILADELTLLPEAFFTQLLSRLSIKGARLLGTTNPGSPQHYLKTKFLNRELDPDMDLKSWHFVMDDNPSLSPEYIRAQRAENTGLFFDRNILGLWKSADGAIYDMWDESKHVIAWEKLPEMQQIMGVGIDHGTTNPTVGIIVGLGVDNNLYAMDEWRHQSRSSEARWTNTQQSAAIRDWLGQSHHPTQAGLGHGFVCVDPAAADFHVQLRQDGTRTHMAENDVLYGIRTTASLLSANRLFVSDRCKGLLMEIPGYTWSSKASEDGKDQPNKVNDHSCDAIRYALATTERRWRKYIQMNAPLNAAA